MEKNLDSGKSNDKPKFQPLESINTDSRSDMYWAMRHNAILVPGTNEVDGKPVIEIHHDIRETLFSLIILLRRSLKMKRMIPGLFLQKANQSSSQVH
jgi:hypothetical protein